MKATKKTLALVVGSADKTKEGSCSADKAAAADKAGEGADQK